MNTIQIGESQHSFCDVTESWIHQNVGQRKDDGQSVCATVTLHSDSVNVVLSTPGCPPSGSGGRPPKAKEAEIINLWQQLHLNDPHWTAGNLTAFVKQVHRLVC